jgi:hypothetical protein
MTAHEQPAFSSPAAVRTDSDPSFNLPLQPVTALTNTYNIFYSSGLSWPQVRHWHAAVNMVQQADGCHMQLV